MILSSGNCLIDTELKILLQGCNNSVIPTDGSVTAINTMAFYGCESLTNITIPDGVTEILNSFEKCTSLKEIIIGNSVTKIGEGIFLDCNALINAYYHGTQEEWQSNVEVEAANENLLNVLRFVDHTWDDGVITTEPTVDAEGVKTYTCACGETKTEAVAKLPALPDEPTDDPTDDSVDEPTDDPVDEPTDDPKDEPAVDQPSDEKPVETPDEGDTEPADGVVGKLLGGCQSVIGSSAMIAISILGAALLTKKKKED